LRSSGEVDVIEWEAGGKDEEDDRNGSGKHPAFYAQPICTALPFWFSRRLIIAPSSMFPEVSPYLRLLDAPDTPLVMVFCYPVSSGSIPIPQRSCGSRPW
jgi:hypothetical protein